MRIWIMILALGLAGSLLQAEELSPAEHLSMAREYLADQQFSEAEASAQAASQMEAGNAEAWLLLGEALEGQGKKKNALAAYEKGLAASPSSSLKEQIMAKAQGLGWSPPAAKAVIQPSPSPAAAEATPVPEPTAYATPAASPRPTALAEAKATPAPTPRPKAARSEGDSGAGKRRGDWSLVLGSFVGYENWFEVARDSGSGSPADKVTGYTGGTLDMSAPKQQGDFPFFASLSYRHWVLDFAAGGLTAPVRFNWVSPSGLEPDNGKADGIYTLMGGGYDWAIYATDQASPADFELYLPLRAHYIKLFYHLENLSVSEYIPSASAGLGLRWHFLPWLGLDAAAQYVAGFSTPSFEYDPGRNGRFEANGFILRAGLAGAF